jgi:hypothetical protein
MKNLVELTNVELSLFSISDHYRCSFSLSSAQNLLLVKFNISVNDLSEYIYLFKLIKFELHLSTENQNCQTLKNLSSNIN